MLSALIRPRLLLMLFLGLFLLLDSITLFQLVLTYLHPNLNVGFLAQHLNDYLGQIHWRGSFFIHAFFGPLILFTGLISIGTMFLPKRISSISILRKIHKTCGKIYVASVLFVAAPTGLVLSFYAHGGIIAKLAFITLSFLWLRVTYQGYRLIRSGRISEHSSVMIWSFGLACAAIVQRRIAFILSFWFTYQGATEPNSSIAFQPGEVLP